MSPCSNCGIWMIIGNAWITNSFLDELSSITPCKIINHDPIRQLQKNQI